MEVSVKQVTDNEYLTKVTIWDPYQREVFVSFLFFIVGVLLAFVVCIFFLPREIPIVVSGIALIFFIWHTGGAFFSVMTVVEAHSEKLERIEEFARLFWEGIFFFSLPAILGAWFFCFVVSRAR